LLASPGCGALSAAKLLGEIGPIERFDTDAQLARHASVALVQFVVVQAGRLIGDVLVGRRRLVAFL
jgi:hypothetical protein